MGRERATSKMPRAIARRVSAYWAAVRAEGTPHTCHLCNTPNTVNYKAGNWCKECAAKKLEERRASR